MAGVVREYLELAFADGNRSLPTEQIVKVTRYVGGTPPAAGGDGWLEPLIGCHFSGIERDPGGGMTC